MKIKDLEGFEIHFEALPEHDQTSMFSLMEADLVEEISKKLESGELVMFTAQVQAYKCGILLHSTWLGSCIYASEEQFYTTEGCYFDQMANEVVSEAKKTIEHLYKSIHDTSTD